ncbi:MAG: glycosyltransferase, partial [Elusimicrobiota bacterium]
MKIALVPATSLDDPTYARVCRGLARALQKRGHAARAFNPRDRAGIRRFAPDIVHAHFAGHLPAATRTMLLRAARLVLTFQDLDHPNHPKRTAAQTRLVSTVVRAARRVTALTPELSRATLAAYPAARGKLSVIG